MNTIIKQDVINEKYLVSTIHNGRCFETIAFKQAKRGKYDYNKLNFCRPVAMQIFQTENQALDFHEQCCKELA